jgi:hypothetical protein
VTTALLALLVAAHQSHQMIGVHLLLLHQRRHQELLQQLNLLLQVMTGEVRAQEKMIGEQLQVTLIGVHQVAVKVQVMMVGNKMTSKLLVMPKKGN